MKNSVTSGWAKRGGKSLNLFAVAGRSLYSDRIEVMPVAFAIAESAPHRRPAATKSTAAVCPISEISPTSTLTQCCFCLHRLRFYGVANQRACSSIGRKRWAREQRSGPTIGLSLSNATTAETNSYFPLVSRNTSPTEDSVDRSGASRAISDVSSAQKPPLCWRKSTTKKNARLQALLGWGLALPTKLKLPTAIASDHRFRQRDFTQSPGTHRGVVFDLLRLKQR